MWLLGGNVSLEADLERLKTHAISVSASTVYLGLIKMIWTLSFLLLLVFLIPTARTVAFPPRGLLTLWNPNKFFYTLPWSWCFTTGTESNQYWTSNGLNSKTISFIHSVPRSALIHQFSNIRISETFFSKTFLPILLCSLEFNCLLFSSYPSECKISSPGI